MALFCQIRTLFVYFQKRAGQTFSLPPPPSPLALLLRPSPLLLPHPSPSSFAPRPSSSLAPPPAPSPLPLLPRPSTLSPPPSPLKSEPNCSFKLGSSKKRAFKCLWLINTANQNSKSF